MNSNIENIRKILTHHLMVGADIQGSNINLIAKNLNEIQKALDNLTSSSRIIESAISAIDDVEYNASSEGCGLEDQGIEDRYEAMEHGYQNGIKAAREAVQHSL